MARRRRVRDQPGGSGSFDFEFIECRAGDEWELQLRAACLRRKAEIEQEEREEGW